MFQEVFFVEAKPPEAHEIAAAQADAVNTTHLDKFSCAMSLRFPGCHGTHSVSCSATQLPCETAGVHHTCVAWLGQRQASSNVSHQTSGVASVFTQT